MSLLPDREKGTEQLVTIDLPPGRLGVDIEQSLRDDGSGKLECVVTSKSDNLSSPLEAGDVILSIDGVVLSDVPGGLPGWVGVIAAGSGRTRRAVVRRPCFPAAAAAPIDALGDGTTTATAASSVQSHAPVAELQTVRNNWVRPPMVSDAARSFVPTPSSTHSNVVRREEEERADGEGRQNQQGLAVPTGALAATTTIATGDGRELTSTEEGHMPFSLGKGPQAVAAGASEEQQTGGNAVSSDGTAFGAGGTPAPTPRPEPRQISSRRKCAMIIVPLLLVAAAGAALGVVFGRKKPAEEEVVSSSSVEVASPGVAAPAPSAGGVFGSGATAVCAEDPDFVDSFGDPCSSYAKAEAFPESCLAFGAVPNEDGETANDRCCACRSLLPGDAATIANAAPASGLASVGVTSSPPATPVTSSPSERQTMQLASASPAGTPTWRPVTPSPTRHPMRPPTRFPTRFPTPYPTKYPTSPPSRPIWSLCPCTDADETGCDLPECSSSTEIGAYCESDSGECGTSDILDNCPGSYDVYRRVACFGTSGPQKMPTPLPTRPPTRFPTRFPTRIPTPSPAASSAVVVDRTCEYEFQYSEFLEVETAGIALAGWQGGGAGFSGDSGMVSSRDSTGKGAVWALSREPGGGWSQYPFTSSKSGDWFGSGRATSENVLATSAPSDGGGKVYVLEKDASGPWSIESIITPSSSSFKFGRMLSISPCGCYIAVGSEEDEYSNGSVWVFGKNSLGSWVENQKLSPSSTLLVKFGHGVAVSSDLLVVTAPQEYMNGIKGVVYLYTLSGNSFILSQKLSAATGSTNDSFYGPHVAILDGFVVVGEDTMKKAYVFQNIGGSYELATELTPSDQGFRSSFGVEIQGDGNKVLISDHYDGSCYLYVHEDGIWKERAKFNKSRPAMNADGNEVVVFEPTQFSTFNINGVSKYGGNIDFYSLECN